MTDTSFRWQISKYGHQNLQRVQVPVPQPGPGQIVVRVEAVSLNYRDLLLTGNDKDYGWSAPLPFVPASDLAGTVSAVGPGVNRWTPGDRVINTFQGGWIDGMRPVDVLPMGGPGPGALASHVVLDAQWASAAPATLDAAQASTLPCAALTAWSALVEEGHLHAGQTVLIHGTGGVSLFGLQFARMHGARAIVVSSAEHKRTQVLAMGASHALSRHDDWITQVRELTGGRGADHVLETVGGANLGRSMKASAQGAHISVIGVLAGSEFAGSAYVAIGTRVTIKGIAVGHRRALESMVRAVDVNSLQPVIAAEYGADDVPAAFRHLERGAFGKVVVRF
ncbi:zinc-dependent alcohol dehydrogenase family protein [Achromobacter aloeverae]|uniref:Alcohol dehydrogenase n=1 Tax=Achromobacter aloeverae TaxID=1750518 RepID=A0A4V1MS20_9BURK|nr:NAD(P)-dependent alcohol dehydrogenase [Achromobacter aloeverae]RXN87950.1 alcohol dehydrogenase [Achromobacter aloeverae]